jgi:hypothetical protein
MPRKSKLTGIRSMPLTVHTSGEPQQQQPIDRGLSMGTPLPPMSSVGATSDARFHAGADDYE